LPFLRQAEKVTVTTVGADQSEDGAIEDVCSYLGTHGVHAKSLRMGDDEAVASDQIFHLAKERGANLIVAGGYGHGRLNEWIFGGLTRDLLARTPVCCLMAH
jgi:nucleotide-binding universal stress UspA family protein